MLKPNQKVAIYMQGFLHSDYGKMGLGIIRYSENTIVGIIDSENAGSNINREYKIDRDIPIYNSLDDVVKKGAEVLILGIAPSGGKIPSDWLHIIELALNAGLCIVNGLHDTLGDRYNHKIKDIKKQWIWDVRIPNIKQFIFNAWQIPFEVTVMVCLETLLAIVGESYEKKEKYTINFIIKPI